MQLTEAGFNYGSLAADKAASARAAAERIRGRMQLAAESIIDVGRELIEQKKTLGHGNFLPWIKAEFGMSDSAAGKYMRIASEFGSNSERVTNLSLRALYALAAPSTPPEVRTEVLARAETGEMVTAKEVEALKAKLKRAQDLAGEKEAQRAAQERLADISAKQAKDAQTKVMYLDADKQRLADELATVRDELSRLSDSDTIHIIREPAAAPEPARVPSLLVQIFDISSDAEIQELARIRRARLAAIAAS